VDEEHTVSYEVDSAEGRCLYRGDDLVLACEIHDQDPTARLVSLPVRRRDDRVPEQRSVCTVTDGRRPGRTRS
jgi:hypothetical protein